MKITIEKLENAWLISEEYDVEDSPNRKYAYSFDMDKEDEELGAQISTLNHLADLIRPYDKYSKNNINISIKAGHKINDEDE